jgi:sarcosine oxidase
MAETATTRRSTYDVIVAGLGAMGSATAFFLAERGARVLGLDRYRPPHAMGSTHGGSRIIRETAFEHPRYVPLVQQAYRSWRTIEQRTGRALLQQTGGLFVGSPDGLVVRGSRASAQAHGIHYEEWPHADLRRRYPVYHPLPGAVGFHDPRAGVLAPEDCVAACLDYARGRGAELRFDEPLLRWEANTKGVTVVTAAGRYTAAHLVLATGAWMREPLAELGVAAVVERVLMHWFIPAEAAPFMPGRFPVSLIEYAPDQVFAAFPLDREGAVKVAVHHGGDVATATTVRRDVAPPEVDAVRAIVAARLPQAVGRWLRSAVCLYTDTPDGDFLIDRDPRSERVILASPCSGFGFKFASAIGQTLADLATGGRAQVDLRPFALGRFQNPRTARG